MCIDKKEDLKKCTIEGISYLLLTAKRFYYIILHKLFNKKAGQTLGQIIRERGRDGLSPLFEKDDITFSHFLEQKTIVLRSIGKATAPMPPRFPPLQESKEKIEHLWLKSL